MKKQSGPVKGKCRDDGLAAAALKQRGAETTQQKEKKANEKEEEPGSSVASLLAGPSTDGMPVP
ncbi:small EDRK-rich factor 2-like [Echinops telfairi]|uniref:Small EDRK-rich factor 2-like n=1 Tax=Echinops telfairi TaxID=9371 RepID=A0AC55CHS6_ECHTE|nr:small EDRK-rich factor 2-like [Echinops telfairi]